MRPDNDRINAIREFSIPTNKKELQSILGIVNCVRQFIPNLADISSPLRELLQNKVLWQWTNRHTELLNKIKTLNSESSLLNNFDTSKQIVMQCNSSKSALGCCLLQDGNPVAYASRSLTETKCYYAQMEKELLSITYSLSKYHNYVYGNKIIIHNDHLLLVSLIKKT